MPYRIAYSPDAEEHLRLLTARQQAIVLDTVDEQLVHQPTLETRNRKPMRPNPVAPWELRIGDLRVYYDTKRRTRAGGNDPSYRNQGKRSSSNRWRKIQAMTKVEFKKASGPLSAYAEKARKDPIIVVKRGKPFAAVIPIRNADEETVTLSTNRKFLKIMDRSRTRAKKEGAISAGELRRRLGLAK